MKSLFDFVFCKGTFSPQTIWFSVRVGTSRRDRAAFRQLAQLASSSPSILLAQHTPQMAEVKEAIARATFPTIERPVAIMRQRIVDVAWLVAFMRHCPWALLNSTRIDKPVTINALTLSGWVTPAQYQLRRTCLTRGSKKNLSRHD